MTSNNFVIRPETPHDVAAIDVVHRAAFPSDPEARLVQALRAAQRLWVSLVAEAAGQVVGHIAFSPVTLSTAAVAGGVGLAPLAVLPTHQQQGIGGQLVRAGLAACVQAGYAYAVVLGDPRYYHKFGFERASDYGLGNEYGVVEEFMVRALRPGGLPGEAGVVRYAPEFALFA